MGVFLSGMEKLSNRGGGGATALSLRSSAVVVVDKGERELGWLSEPADEEPRIGGKEGFTFGKVSCRTFNANCLFSSTCTTFIKVLDDGELIPQEEEMSITRESSEGIGLASSTIMTRLSSATMSDIGGEHGRRGSATVLLSS